jgi:DUF1016 N-terminal domain/YhcG PDDEXK nuclease domain
LNTAFALSWSHYVFLLQVDEKKERKFYEIESAANNWSLRELKRQFNSGYYQQLLVGKNKAKDEHSTIGIILCRHKTDTLVEFTLPKNNSQVFARNYKLVMPTKKQLQNILKNYD